MAGTLYATQRFVIELASGAEIDVGSLTMAQSLDLTNGTVVDVMDVIADDFGKDVLWTKGEGGMDTFEALLFSSNVDVWLEFRTDLGAGAQYILREFQGGVWHLLTSDEIASAAATVLDGAVLVEDTDYAQVDRIEAHNNVAADAGDAVVRLILLA